MRTSYQERRALGCRVQLAIVSDNEQAAGQLLDELWLQILYFEKRCSRFLPDSELSQFNRLAGTRQYVSDELREILAAAKTMALRTGGLYNPFILPAVQRAGYVHSLELGRSSDAADDFSRRRLVPADRLEMGEGWVSIPYGTAIDLGGCGKGFIGDKLSDVACRHPEVAGYWFSVGGDVILGGADEQGKAWQVDLRPDPQGGSCIGQVSLPAGGQPFAVATSTTRFRKGQGKDGAWHHIIDPRTGKASRSGIDLATVCATSLLTADVLATCAIIAGPAQAESFLRSQPDVTAGAWQCGPASPLQLFGGCITAATPPKDAQNPADAL